MTAQTTEFSGRQQLQLRSLLRKAPTFALLAIFILNVHPLVSGREPQPPTEIFPGVTYGSQRIETSREGNGLLHWARVDLMNPDVEIYITPIDSYAASKGWQYRLRYIDEVLKTERLSLSINATFFSSNSGLLRLPGDLAMSEHTIVANRAVSHISSNTYLLWADDQQHPRLESLKAITQPQLASAKWGIGTHVAWLRDGKVWSHSDRTPGSRTAVGIDSQRRMLFLAVAQFISPRLLMEHLAQIGARDAMSLDGGSSSSMAIGQHAQGVQPGIVHGGWRPVATYLGVRSRSATKNQKSAELRDIRN